MTDKTITPEQAKELFEHAGTLAAFCDKLAESGITIAPPQSSPEMVSLAEQIAYDAGDNLMPRDYALAALQHFERVVVDAPAAVSEFHRNPRAYISRPAILTAIGSNRHD